MSKTAFLFPGQGAQAVGMGKEFYDSSREAKEIYKRADSLSGFDLTALCFEGPQEELTRTERCQLALLVTGYAAYSAFITRMPAFAPSLMAGLSLGEITALVAADAISFKDALYVVQVRGEAMAECAANQSGAMLAVIGMAREAIADLCKDSGAYAANFNSPEQVVLSGEAAAIDAAESLAKERGAKRAAKLEVSGAFHSPLMRPAADKLERALEHINIHSPSVPVYSNVTARPVDGPQQIKELLVKQVVSPVCWDTSVVNMIQAGAGTFVEFPPAKVLAALLRRIDKTVKVAAVNAPDDLEKLVPVKS